MFIFFKRNTQIKIKSFECPKSIRYYEKKIMLVTSDAWSMSHLSHRPSEPAYYIEDCRISAPTVHIISISAGRCIKIVIARITR